MKSWKYWLPLTLLLAGCATTDTIENRRKEKGLVYAGLAPEIRALVDRGEIQVGLPMDAVYIAWGRPSQVLQAEGPDGKTLTWLYQSQTLEEVRYWGPGPFGYGYRRYRTGPRFRYEYIPRIYVSAEVIFQNGLVRSFRTMPPPY